MGRNAHACARERGGGEAKLRIRPDAWCGALSFTSSSLPPPPPSTPSWSHLPPPSPSLPPPPPSPPQGPLQRSQLRTDDVMLVHTGGRVAARTHARTRTHTHAPARPHARPHARAHTHTRARTHTMGIACPCASCRKGVCGDHVATRTGDSDRCLW